MTDVRVVGAGPAGLMAAEVLAASGMRVTIVDHHKSPARKFLLAGRGGLNLTHSDPLEQLLSRYAGDRPFLETAIRAFPPDALRAWCEGLGIKTFIGSSGRVFPVGMKASPLLRAWLRRLQGLGVTLQSQTAWAGFDDVPTILALGGGSWPELGSDAKWVSVFEAGGIEVVPLVASNVRLPVAWSEHFSSRFAGHPLKTVAVRAGQQVARGELMITRDGIEGGAVYAMSRALRETGAQAFTIDLKPDVSEGKVLQRLTTRQRKDSASTFLRKAFNLGPQAIGLMRETGSENPKQVKVQIAGPSTLARAISTAGGVAKHEVDENFALRKFANTFVVGEMLDWDAPTGGYLLQACFSTAHFAAQKLCVKLGKRTGATAI